MKPWMNVLEASMGFYIAVLMLLATILNVQPSSKEGPQNGIFHIGHKFHGFYINEIDVNMGLCKSILGV